MLVRARVEAGAWPEVSPWRIWFSLVVFSEGACCRSPWRNRKKRGGRGIGGKGEREKLAGGNVYEVEEVQGTKSLGGDPWVKRSEDAAFGKRGRRFFRGSWFLGGRARYGNDPARGASG